MDEKPEEKKEAPIPVKNIGKTKKLKVPIKVRIKARMDKARAWFDRKAEWFEAAFFIGCIYVLLIFTGREHSWLTGLASVAIYFIAVELLAHARNILSVLKR